MATAPGTADQHELAFEAFGVRIGFSTNDPRLLERFRDFIPPTARFCDPATAEHRFGLVSRNGDDYTLRLNEEWSVEYKSVETALGLLDTHMCGYIAVHADEHIFVHAGAVAHQDRLIIIPGMSFSGKSTLVAALVRAGATYYSDDFALLDETGRVHPYPKPVSLRGWRLNQTAHTAESLGGTVGTEARAPSLIIMTTYRPDAKWNPRRLSSGEAAIAVLANTVPAQERPAESLRAVTRAVEGAVVLESERGEAADVVPHLLAEL
jgi:hypothetical protein